jgi:hypothetical protein
MLRHACAFKLANDGVDTRSLQAYLGTSQYPEYDAIYAARAGSVQGFLAGLITGTDPNFRYRRESRRLLARTRFLKTLSVFPATTRCGCPFMAATAATA